MSVARFSFGGVAIRYVLPVLCMTSCLYIMARNRRRSSDSVGSSVAHTQTDTPGGSTRLGAESDIYDGLVWYRDLLLPVYKTT